MQRGRDRLQVLAVGYSGGSRKEVGEGNEPDRDSLRRASNLRHKRDVSMGRV